MSQLCRGRSAVLALVVAILLAACHQESGEEESSSGGGEESTTGEEVDPGPDLDRPLMSAEQMFSLEYLPTFYIDVPPESMAKLAEEPKVYVPGSFRYLDYSYPLIGVRLKGNISLTPLDEKPSFKIKFREYTQGPDFLGLKKLTLHNMHQDASMMREHLGYKMFRELGVPASRTGYAKLVVNGQPYGVYLNVETPDDRMLERIFGAGAGNLYEGEHNDDIEKSPDSWEQDEGEDLSREDLAQLRIVATETPEQLFLGAKPALDVPRVLNYLVGESYLGHFDGYWVSHNFFVHHDLAVDNWSWLPWSLDQAWVRREDPFDGGGFVKETCLDIPACLTQYVQTGLRAVDHLEQASGLAEEVDRILYVIDGPSHEDDRKRHSNGSMERSQERLRNWLAERPGAMRERLDCLNPDGTEPDLDGDGFGGCFRDCDDRNPAVHPNAEEICGNGIDDDCNGAVDDKPECPCPSADFEGATFHFCPHHWTWKKAKTHCKDQGLALAFFDTATQNDLVSAHARATLEERWAFGLSDSDTEGTFVWQHGEAPSFTRWADGEPAHRLEWFDCVFFTRGGSGSWQELNCIQEGPFICRAAPPDGDGDDENH